MVIKKIDNFSNISPEIDRSLNDLYTWALRPLKYKRSTNITYTVPTDTEYLEVDTSDNVITLTLPDVSDFNHRILKIKDINGNASAKNITISPAESLTKIDGASTLVLNSSYGKVNLYSNGSNWFTI